MAVLQSGKGPQEPLSQQNARPSLRQEHAEEKLQLRRNGKCLSFKSWIKLKMLIRGVCVCLCGCGCVSVWVGVCVFQVKERAENLGSAFLHKGHSKSNRPHIGIFSQNRPEVSSPLSVSTEMSQQAAASPQWSRCQWA